MAIALELGATPDEVRDALLALGLRPNARTKFDPVGYVLARLEQPEHGCWVWRGAMHSGKHPAATVAGAQLFVARVLWEHFVGDIGTRHLRRVCDVERCVRPSHHEPGPGTSVGLSAKKRVARS